MTLATLSEVLQPAKAGGYAVADYRAVEPSLGTMDELEALAGTLHEAGIRLCLDFVMNHTADDHGWAQAAKAGDPACQAYYRMFDSKTETDAYRPMLREIFPDRGGDPFLWVRRSRNGCGAPSIPISGI